MRGHSRPPLLFSICVIKHFESSVGHFFLVLRSVFWCCRYFLRLFKRGKIMWRKKAVFIIFVSWYIFDLPFWAENEAENSQNVFAFTKCKGQLIISQCFLFWLTLDEHLQTMLLVLEITNMYVNHQKCVSIIICLL